MRTRLLAVFLTAVLASVSEAQKVPMDTARWHCLDKVPLGLCRDANITFPKGKVDTVRTPAVTSSKDSAPKTVQESGSSLMATADVNKKKSPESETKSPPKATEQSSRATSLGLPFYDKNATKPVYAFMIEHGKGTNGITFNTTSEKAISAWNKAYPDLGLENRQDLANHLRSMQTVLCPKVRTRLAWVVESSRDVRLDGWSRELGTGVHDGEQCLLNTEKHRIEASLLCGNIILDLPFGVPAVVVTPPPAIPVAKEVPVVVPPPTLDLIADSYTVPYNTGTILRWFPKDAKDCPATGDWSGAKSPTGWYEPTGNLTRTSIYGLQCFGPGGHVYKSVTVNVLLPLIPPPAKCSGYGCHPLLYTTAIVLGGTCIGDMIAERHLYCISFVFNGGSSSKSKAH